METALEAAAPRLLRDGGVRGAPLDSRAVTTSLAAGVHARIEFVGAAAAGDALRAVFERPREILRADRLDEVGGVLDAAEAHARQGRWCVGYLRYEAAPAFDAALEVRTVADADTDTGPLAWFAVFDQALPWPAWSSATGYEPLRWQPTLDRAGFDGRIARIHRAIADGEVYQINLTAPLVSHFDGDPLALFDALRRAQPQAYAAFIATDHGEQLLSVSPELFFDWRDGRLLARPMKGTAPRGANEADDIAQRERLRASEKERAENLMIVDLLRNDLSRIAEPHSVQVPALFDARAWPTVWQMTSDVVARPRAGTTLAQVFGALFPCGSITGAPKRQAMRWIARLEDAPRGVYCGAIGVLQPGGAATFSVAIRTVVRHGDALRCGIGSGITADASAAAEWAEWQHKRGFLERAAQPFELLQTMRLQQGGYRALELHLARLREAARHFGHPLDEAVLQRALAACREQHGQGAWRVRLRVDAHGRVHCEAHDLAPTNGPVTAALAASPIETPTDFLRFKTTRRAHYEAFAPTTPALFDTLLWNAQREITEFTRGNVIAQLDDGRWITPPLRCGLLDGVGRALALERSEVREAPLRVDELPRVRRLLFVNALRGEIEVRLPLVGAA
jgi:para-aminobenzoate synthetase/4-amino-4-deoxychorismate lyase